MTPYIFLLAASCVVSAFCAGAIFTREPERSASRLSALLLTGAAYWAVCEIAWNLAADAETALRWMKISAPGWMFIGPLVLHIFVGAAPRPSPRLRRLVAPLYAAAIVFLGLTWTTGSVIGEAQQTGWGWAYEVGTAYPLFYVTTMTGVICACVVASQFFRGTISHAERRQRPWIALGVAIPMIVASLTDVILPMIGHQVPRLGTTSFAILGGIALWNVLHFGYSFLTPGTFADEILATLPDGVALLHPDERVRSANDALSRLCGRPLGALLGLPVDELLTRKSSDPPDPLAEVHGELHHVSGERIPVAVSTSPLRDRQGYAVGCVLVTRDLREVEALRQRLVTSGRLAAVGELAAGVAHEINNPIAFVRANLNQLRGHWKTLRGELGGDDARGLRPLLCDGEELIEESIEGVDRAAEIVRGVRSFSHQGSGEREPADLNQLLEEVLRMAATQLRGNATVERHYVELPPIPCAPQELKQVFLNLILNAGQAIVEGGRIRLETRNLKDAVTVTIEDDGRGIDPEHLDRIFDPFFTTKRVGEGTGLGLGIAYRIVKSHQGEISVESKPGRGSTFTVRLPAF